MHEVFINILYKKLICHFLIFFPYYICRYFVIENSSWKSFMLVLSTVISLYYNSQSCYICIYRINFMWNNNLMVHLEKV